MRKAVRDRAYMYACCVSIATRASDNRFWGRFIKSAFKNDVSS